MATTSRFTTRVALTVALGGFLMGFDASVISGVVGYLETEFTLTKLELGWSVSSLALSAAVAMMIAGPLSDRVGRRPVLMIAAALFAASALVSALAPSFLVLVIARMVGGLGVGAALIIAPIYIAEIAPAEQRGRMVSFNQLNIVIGISAAFFSNYLILLMGQAEMTWSETLMFDSAAWRWMLGVETFPAIVYFFALFFVPESPRWLAMRGREGDALNVLEDVGGEAHAARELAAVKASIRADEESRSVSFRELLNPSLRLVLTIGLAVGILQQATGINSVFFYSPMIFEQSGIGTNAAFMQAVLVGIVNLAFTVVAMSLIDRLGRRPLLGCGLAGIAISMLILSYAFGAATYRLDAADAPVLPVEIDRGALSDVVDITFDTDTDFRAALYGAIGEETYKAHESALVSAAIDTEPRLILVAILGFVASFAMSIGPIMWVLFSELFPNRVRGVAISFVGLVNSAVAFLVTLLFPWELETLGTASTFFLYGLFALIGLVFIMRILPETKGRSLEDLETLLARR